MNQMIKNLYVIILLDGMLFALDAAFYEKTLKYSNIAYLRTESKSFIGLVEDNHEMIPIFNPRLLVNLYCFDHLSSHVIVVLKYRDKKFGILVDEFVDVITFDTIDKTYYPELSKHIIGTGKKHDIPMTLIDIHDTLYEIYLEHFE